MCEYDKKETSKTNDETNHIVTTLKSLSIKRFKYIAMLFCDFNLIISFLKKTETFSSF